MINAPSCPEHNLKMVKRKSKFPGRPFFWGCEMYPLCTYRIGAHPSGEPLGTPADPETRQWRIKAHDAFDRVWKQWGYTREEAYNLLSLLMNVPLKDAHIANFNLEQCKKVVAECDKIYYGEITLKKDRG